MNIKWNKFIYFVVFVIFIVDFSFIVVLSILKYYIVNFISVVFGIGSDVIE